MPNLHFSKVDWFLAKFALAARPFPKNFLVADTWTIGIALSIARFKLFDCANYFIPLRNLLNLSAKERFTFKRTGFKASLSARFLKNHRNIKCKVPLTGKMKTKSGASGELKIASKCNA